MFLLGLLLPITYIPAITGGAMATQWALISLVVPGMLWFGGPRPIIILHYLGLGFLAWVLASVTWSPQPLDGIYGAWIVVLWALCFQLGYSRPHSFDIYRGLAWGLYINIAIAIVQWLGYHPFPVFSEGTPQSNIAGLLYNRTVLGAACALVALAMIEHHRYHHAAMLFVGVALSGSRGAILAIAFALAAHRSRFVAFSILTCAALAALTFDTGSDHERLTAWGVILRNLTTVGWGPATTTYLLMGLPDHTVAILAAHNDYLQLAFEYGLGAALPITILALALIHRPSLITLGFACFACFWFPLYTPVTAFISLFALGDSVWDFSLPRTVLNHRRSHLPPSPTHQFPRPPQPSSIHLPILP